MSLRGAELHGIFNVELYLSGGSFVRKFIIPSGLIPDSYKLKLFSAGAKLRGIKPDFRIKGLPPEKFFRVYAKLDNNLLNDVDLVDFDENNNFYALLNSLGEIVEIG